MVRLCCRPAGRTEKFSIFVRIRQSLKLTEESATTSMSPFPPSSPSVERISGLAKSASTSSTVRSRSEAIESARLIAQKVLPSFGWLEQTRIKLPLRIALGPRAMAFSNSCRLMIRNSSAVDVVGASGTMNPIAPSASRSMSSRRLLRPSSCVTRGAGGSGGAGAAAMSLARLARLETGLGMTGAVTSTGSPAARVIRAAARSSSDVGALGSEMSFTPHPHHSTTAGSATRRKGRPSLSPILQRHKATPGPGCFAVRRRSRRRYRAPEPRMSPPAWLG